ncbi:MAG TPA: prepilin-type N-terminal cleavage/methylation domain-containing protein [Rickettsiales bacterium]|nr:prepilin-type N-terminal cleavage/methylation domain-containing protein [Rickettsiales bacterium]
MKQTPPIHPQGFTLIELSIVLVIVGLIVGGILVGQDLITSASVRAQVAQIEKLNTAVHAFQYKYGGIPGDLELSQASKFGFITNACDGRNGGRDGNGKLEGYYGTPYYLDQFLGETELFWEDLSTAQLVSGTYPGGSTTRDCDYNNSNILTLTPGPDYIGNFIPAGKIGFGNFVHVYTDLSFNWYGLAQITPNPTYGYVLAAAPSIPVISAYNIDAKADDGMPNTGTIQAQYLTGYAITLAPNNTAPNYATCYDTTSKKYSVGYNNGTGPNCALSFRFQ